MQYAPASALHGWMGVIPLLSHRKECRGIDTMYGRFGCGMLETPQKNLAWHRCGAHISLRLCSRLC